MEVICNMRERCHEENFCGGAQPHTPDNECGRCPFDLSAECIPITPLKDEKGQKLS